MGISEDTELWHHMVASASSMARHLKKMKNHDPPPSDVYDPRPTNILKAKHFWRWSRPCWDWPWHRRRSSVNFRGHKIFARKYVLQISKMPEFYMILARKIWYLPEKFTKFPNFTWFLPEKCPNFTQKLPEKYFFPNFRGARARLLRLWLGFSAAVPVNITAKTTATSGDLGEGVVNPTRNGRPPSRDDPARREVQNNCF